LTKGYTAMNIEQSQVRHHEAMALVDKAAQAKRNGDQQLYFI